MKSEIINSDCLKGRCGGLINKLHNCDNVEILAQLPDKSLDLILEDMPYNNTNLAFEYAVDLEKYWSARLPKIKDNGAIILTGQQPFSSDLIVSNRKMFRYEIIWKKTQPLGFLDAKKRPLRAHENILVFFKKTPTYNPQKTLKNDVPIGRTRKMRAGRADHYHKMRTGQYVEDGTRYPLSVLEISNWNGGGFVPNTQKAIHPTQKPVELFSWLIRSYTNEGDLVFDGFGGSGTTAVSCLWEKRNFIVCEWDKKYFDQSQARLKDEQKKLAEYLAQPKLFEPVKQSAEQLALF